MPDDLPTFTTEILSPSRYHFGRERGTPFCFPFVALREPSGQKHLLTFRCATKPQFLCNVLGNWSDEPSPRLSGLAELDNQRRADATVSVSIFPEIHFAKGFALNPIKNEGVAFWPDGFENVEDQTIPSRCIYVEQTHRYITSHRDASSPRFHFQN